MRVASIPIFEPKSCRRAAWSRVSTGPSVNHLTIDAVDPGAGTQETKACLVNVVKVADGKVAGNGPRGRV